MDPDLASSPGGRAAHAPTPHDPDTGPFEPASTNPEITATLVGLASALDPPHANEETPLSTVLRAGTAADILAAITHDLGPDQAQALVDWLSEPDQPERHKILDSLFLGTGAAPIRARITALNRRILARNIFDGARVASLLRACHPKPESLS